MQKMYDYKIVSEYNAISGTRTELGSYTPSEVVQMRLSEHSNIVDVINTEYTMKQELSQTMTETQKMMAFGDRYDALKGALAYQQGPQEQNNNLPADLIRDDDVVSTFVGKETVCRQDANRISYELDALSITNNILFIKYDESVPFSHVANVYEENGHLYVADLVLSTKYPNTADYENYRRIPLEVYPELIGAKEVYILDKNQSGKAYNKMTGSLYYQAKINN